MARDERVTPYKLEQHLNEMCSSDLTYTNLLSTWNINKKACQDALSTVVMSYPHYTKHDISHCEAVITAIEKLLGEETIRTLSPTDTWLLLQAAYLHDIGMVIECKRIEENWKTEEFQEYLHESEESSDKSLAESAKYINSFRNASREEDVLSWPVNVRYAVTLLIADYYRRRHAKDSDLYVQDMGKVFHIDLGFNGLIQSRLVYLLADIVGMHGEACDKVLELDYVTDGFNADFAHPRFLAEMLRMGDLLDADNNRFNDTNEIVFGKIPESSKNHWEKHMSVRHLLVTPDVIEYRADCEKTEVYREHRRFLMFLKEEITFWTFHWKDIMPEDIKGSAPKLGRCELLLNGVPDVQGISDLRFWISQEKAFEILEGANIYDDQFVFLREVIQNALDACKVQMWRDLREERYRGWITGPIDSTIQPFEIKDEIFKNYVVQVKVCDFDKDHVEVIVKDNGTGISAEQFKKICNVGLSYFGDRERKREIESMPAWLQPTAGFGIGLQSIFLVAEEFTIYSKSSNDQGICATIASSRKGGYVEIMKDDTVKSRGTEVHVVLKREFKIDSISEFDSHMYMRTAYDPFFDMNIVLFYEISGKIDKIIEQTYFPVEVYFDNEQRKTFEIQQMEGFKKSLFDSRYWLKVIEGSIMEIWDSKTCTKARISLLEKDEKQGVKCFFKGMRIQEPDCSYPHDLTIHIDFCGMDAKHTLTLDRKRIKRETVVEVNQILSSAVQFYLNEIEEYLLSENKNRNKEDYVRIYLYWCMVSLKRKQELLKKYKDLFQKIRIMIPVFKKNSNDQFRKQELVFSEIMNKLDVTATVYGLGEFADSENRKQVNLRKISAFLKQGKIPFSIIVADMRFTHALQSASYKRAMILSNKNDSIHLVSCTSDKGELLEVDEETRKYLVKTLLKKNLHYLETLHDSIRRYMPGIKNYARICTSTMPDGIKGEWDPGTGYIISPITIIQWKQYNSQECDAFVDLVCVDFDFSNLIDYVYNHQFKEKEYSKKEIEETYKKLIRDIYYICDREN